MKKKLLTGLVTGLILVGMVGMANATVIINVTEVGSDVVFMSTGSLDLTGSSFVNDYPIYDPGFISGGDNWWIGSGPVSPTDGYALTAFDGAFGTSTSFFNTPSLLTGDSFFIWGNGGMVEQVGVMDGYISGTSIMSQMVFNNATIAGLSLLAGSYDYSLPNDIITLNIGAAPVPEPATILLLGGGLAGLVFYRRKRK